MDHRWIKPIRGTATLSPDWQIARIIDIDNGLIRFKIIGSSKSYVLLEEDLEIGDFVSENGQESNKFAEGAEAFKKMLLSSMKSIFWPHIEGVFSVFAIENHFEPK